MDKYTFKATNLIAETFDKHGIKYNVEEAPGAEIIVAGFPVDGGPAVTEWFISRDNDNDVAARVFRLVSKTPEARRSRVRDACNILNRKVRYMKFSIDADGDVNAEYDFPVQTPDSGVGEMALEIFVRTMRTLDSEYSLFMKAIYTDATLEEESLMQKLERLYRMQEARKASVENAIEADESVYSEFELETADSSDNLAG